MIFMQRPTLNPPIPKKRRLQQGYFSKYGIMLATLKEKLLSVQDGIASSLKGDEQVRHSDRWEYLAGARLLAKYQKDWEDIHTFSEQNARQAKDIDKKIEDVHSQIKQDWFRIRKFNRELGDLETIVTLAEKSVNAIGSIRTLAEEVQDKIIELEELIEQERQVKAMEHALERLADYRKDKLISLDALREKLAEDYEMKLKLVEREKEEEKKRNFELAEKRFLEDLNAYKESGVLPRRGTGGEKTLSIEDVEIEQDLDSLHEYLES